MSANNWQVCPRCKRQNDEERSKEQAEIEGQYGKIPSAEYMQLLEKSKKRPSTISENLREDWEIWTDLAGTFNVIYHCSCDACGLDYTFRHTEKIVD